MEQNIHKAVRIRRSKHEITRLLAEFERSDVSVLEFCQRHGTSKATFYKWQSRYNMKIKKRGKAPCFVPLQITSSPLGSGAALFAQVKGIQIYQMVAASYLKELL